MTPSPDRPTATPRRPDGATPRSPDGAAQPPRRRDAARTRQSLLDAARHRFARDGYAATTLRDIAVDAGVNVALISRYFESKEGLFAAALSAAVEEMRRTAGEVPLSELPQTMAREIAGSSSHGQPNQILPLLLRSSGDEQAELIRLGVLRTYAERLVAIAGWQPGDPGADQATLRAQVLLAASIGIALLRSSGLQPLASAGEDDLAGALRDMVDGLLPPR